MKALLKLLFVVLVSSVVSQAVKRKSQKKSCFSPQRYKDYLIPRGMM